MTSPGSPDPQPAIPVAPVDAGAGDTIVGYDAFGRRVQIGRDEYRRTVLPELLKAYGSHPDRLAALILQAVRDGCADDVRAAANRLSVIDGDLDRALSILAVVQRDCGELDTAEATLRELLQRRPESVAARVGLALLADRRGDEAECSTLLWEALQRDSNHPDAVHGYLQIRHRAVGDAGYRAELERLAALPESWRGRLWLARWLLAHGEADAAAGHYRSVLTAAQVAGDAVMMAGADLLQHQQHELIAELVAPRFVPGSHHPHAGLALLHHHLARRDHRSGAALLHQMHLHYGHLVGAELQPFTAEFDRLRLADLPPPPLAAEPRVGLFRFEHPIWCAGLGNPTWLLPTKAAGQKQVLAVALAVEGQTAALSGREEEIGRLSRSVPLFLAEQIWLATPHRGGAVLPVVQGGGWAVVGKPWPIEQLSRQLSAADRADTLWLTGVVRVDGEGRRLDLWLHDAGSGQRLGHAAAEGPHAELGRLLLQLVAELWPHFGGPAGHRPPVGNDSFWHHYADGLGQHAALVVTEAGGMARERLYGERYIVQWLQNTALEDSRWQPAFWLWSSALAVLHRLGSPVPREHARTVGEVFRSAPADSAFAKLAVVPLRAVGLEALWAGRRAEIVGKAAGDERYRAWLAAIEAGPR